MPMHYVSSMTIPSKIKFYLFHMGTLVFSLLSAGLLFGQPQEILEIKIKNYKYVNEHEDI